ncbi:hypothetical protein IQ06DRAFT_90716 [Phaeosphaeriaceae sp. SRC1lsM3a]|nr:hypothetical protein IQ06DRAFT_90716 [Stagonospora sp. SRC1lsM3a]
MNPQMAPHQQGSFQGQVPQQAQNANQQRQVPNVQQKATIGAQGAQNLHNNFDPQLTLWSLERAKAKDLWTDVKPQQQHIALKELQDELEKFKQRDLTAKRILDELDSTSCRKLINKLADDQTKELQKLNKSLKYILAGILPKWNYVDRRKKEKYLGRVQVILQTVPSGLMEPQAQKSGGAGAGNAMGTQAKQAGNFQGQQSANGAGHAVKNVHPQGQQHMGNGQHFEQHLPPPPGGHQNGNHGPPPPPPPPNGHHGGNPPPPPPPPNGGHGHGHGSHQPQFQRMPGSFPESYHMNQGRPPIEVLDPNLMYNQKHKQKHHRRANPDDSSSLSSEWESETNSSHTGSYNAYSVEDGYSNVRKGHRKHTNRDGHARKSSHHRRRSQSRSSGLRKSDQKSSRQRRNSDSSGVGGRTGRRSSASPRAKSPYYSSGDDSGRSRKKKYKYQNRSAENLTQEYNRKAAKFGTPPLSRESSQGSWTDASSSEESGSFSRRMRESDGERERGHRRRRKHSSSRHHAKEYDSSRYDIPDPRYVNRDVRADDYPYDLSRENERRRAETIFGNRRPTAARHSSEQPNPFFQDTIPLRQTREQAYNSYGTGLREQDFAYAPSQGYVRGNSPPKQDLYTSDEVNVLLNRLNQEQQRRPLGRSQTMGTTFLDSEHARVPLRSQYMDPRDQGFLDEDNVNPRFASRVPGYRTGYGR